jgi:NADPH:quinone reductase-like Zn-dependent oxidoreductase
VTRFRPGDEVFGSAPGAFAEYASAKEDHLLKKPPGLSFEQLATLPVAGSTSLQGLRDKAGVRPGQHVLIHGAGGGVGTFAVQIAKALGAHVTAVTSTRNLDLIGSLGPDELIDYTREDFTRREKRYDVFFDIAATRSLGACRRVLTPKGTLVLVGAPKDGMGALLKRMVAIATLSPFVSQRMRLCMARIRLQDLTALTELIEAGKLSPVIERTYSLPEVPDAIRYLASGQGRAKVVIKVS